MIYGDDTANTLEGGPGDDIIFGIGGDDTLTGNDGNDILDGGAGDDILTGGQGNDTYVIDSASDIINELAGQGTDMVKSYISYDLADGSAIENVTLLGNLAIDATGNGNNTILTGNAGDNHLRGFQGDDVLRGMDGNDFLDAGFGTNIMKGGAGDDTYLVNSSGDSVIESSGGIDQGGHDVVVSWIDFQLPRFVEDLVLIGYGPTGRGNALDNKITGNGLANTLYGLEGNDTLDGMYGADIMIGGSSNDTYFVDNVGDVCREDRHDGGKDQVNATVSYTLSRFVETLILIGNAAINATGSADDNYLRGNNSANVIKGLAGNDTLYGLGGADTFVFSHYGAPNGVDSLKDFATGVDKLSFTASDFGWTAGHVLTEFSTNGVASGNGGQFVYDPSTRTLSWDSNGAMAGGATAIAIFLNATPPAGTDFVFT